MAIPTLEELAVLRPPQDLCRLVEPNRLGISDEDFFNKAAGGLHQKLREAWVLSRIGIAIDRAVSPVQVKVVDGPLLDGNLKFQNGQEWNIEIVTVLRPGERPGVEYQHGKRPHQRLSDFSGQPSEPAWIRAPVLAKVKKAQKQSATCHLIAYLNYGGGVPYLNKVAAQIPEAQSAFESTWLVTGAMFALLFGHLVQVPDSVRTWQSYLEWLPSECKP